MTDFGEIAMTNTPHTVNAMTGNEPREAWSDDGELFKCDSLGELLDMMDDPQPGAVVYVGDAVEVSPGRLVHADDVIDIMADRAFEIAGDAADEYPAVSDEARAGLNSLLAAWIKEHCPPTFYTVERVKPYTLTEDDLS